MNKQEVVMTIKIAGQRFGRIMACFNGAEYTAGYYQAINDMVKLFDHAPLDADFDAERENLLRHVSGLSKERNELRAALNERDATIEKLMKHIDLGEVLGVKPKVRRHGGRR